MTPVVAYAIDVAGRFESNIAIGRCTIRRLLSDDLYGQRICAGSDIIRPINTTPVIISDRDGVVAGGKIGRRARGESVGVTPGVGEGSRAAYGLGGNLTVVEPTGSCLGRTIDQAYAAVAVNGNGQFVGTAVCAGDRNRTETARKIIHCRAVGHRVMRPGVENGFDAAGGRYGGCPAILAAGRWGAALQAYGNAGD